MYLPLITTLRRLFSYLPSYNNWYIRRCQIAFKNRITHQLIAIEWTHFCILSQQSFWRILFYFHPIYSRIGWNVKVLIYKFTFKTREDPVYAHTVATLIQVHILSRTRPHNHQKIIIRFPSSPSPWQPHPSVRRWRYPCGYYNGYSPMKKSHQRSCVENTGRTLIKKDR